MEKRCLIPIRHEYNIFHWPSGEGCRDREEERGESIEKWGRRNIGINILNGFVVAC